MNFAQLFRIGRRFLRDHGRPKFANAFELRRKIDNRFPIRDLIGHFVADAFSLAKFVAFCGEDLLRLL